MNARIAGDCWLPEIHADVGGAGVNDEKEGLFGQDELAGLGDPQVVVLTVMHQHRLVLSAQQVGDDESARLAGRGLCWRGAGGTGHGVVRWTRELSWLPTFCQMKTIINNMSLCVKAAFDPATRIMVIGYVYIGVALVACIALGRSLRPSAALPRRHGDRGRGDRRYTRPSQFLLDKIAALEVLVRLPPQMCGDAVRLDTTKTRLRLVNSRLAKDYHKVMPDGAGRLARITRGRPIWYSGSWKKSVCFGSTLEYPSRCHVRCAGLLTVYPKALPMRHAALSSVTLICLSCLAGLAAAETPLLLHGGDKPFLFGFGTWDKAPQFPIGAQGIHITTTNGQGGAGLAIVGNPAGAAQLGWTPAVTVTVAAGNKATALSLVLQDGDETKILFRLPLNTLTPGTAGTVIADSGATLGQPAGVENAGSIPGFDPATIRFAMIVGIWTADPVDLHLSRITLVPPGKAASNAVPAAKPQAVAQPASTAAQPVDGPEPTFICAVAPDVLAITVQACTQVSNQLLPYVAQPGDQITEEKGTFFEAHDDGVKERHLRMVMRNGAALGLLSPDGKLVAITRTSSGQVLDETAVDAPTSYTITSPTDQAYAKPMAPTAVFRKGKPNGHSRPFPFLYTVSLRLPAPLQVGASYTVRFTGVPLAKESITYVHQPRTARSLAIHTLQTGYRPDDTFKRAYCSFWMGVDHTGTHGSCTPTVTSFELLDAKSGTSVFSGTAELAKGATATEQLSVHDQGDYSKSAVYRLDFSAFATPGDYLVHVPGLGVSYPLRLATNAWEVPFKAAMQGILAQRQGIDLGPPAIDFIRKRAFHPDDGVRFYQMTGTVAAGQEAGEGGHAGRGGDLIEQAKKGKLTRTTIVPGAYQDAGDWDTQGHHLSATYDLLGLYLLNPEAVKRTTLRLPAAEMANAIPDIIDEAMWQMPTFRSLQLENGSVRGGYGYGWGCPPGMTSAMMTSAAVYAPDVVTTLHYAAAAARAARVLADFDKAKAAEWLASARKAWDWAEVNGGKDAGDSVNYRAMAAVELLAATRDPIFDAAFAQSTELHKSEQFLSQPHTDFAYARLPDGLGDAALKQKATARILAYADYAAEHSRKNAFDIVAGRRTDLPLIGPCTWISVPAQGGMLPIYAYELAKKPEHLRLAVQGGNYSLGANPDNLSYCTGVGANWQRYPFMVDGMVTGQFPDLPIGHIPYGQGNEGQPMSRGANDWVQKWFINFQHTKKMIPNWYDLPVHEAYIDFSIYPMINENCFNHTEVPAACYWFWLHART